jgi:predicted nucleic acid-binding protein
MDAKREGWLTVADPLEPDATRRLIEQHGLEIGECEAILLASAIGAEALLVDEQRAVALARRLGLPVVRTTALYVAAKRLGLLETVRPKLDALRAFGFWLSDAGYASVLRAAGEQ